jgi:hypothetical protein
MLADPHDGCPTTERFILVHGFRGFSSWLLGLVVALGSVEGSTSWWEWGKRLLTSWQTGQAMLTYSMEARERERERERVFYNKASSSNNGPTP